MYVLTYLAAALSVAQATKVTSVSWLKLSKASGSLMALGKLLRFCFMKSPAS